MCSCCDPTHDSPDPVVVRLQKEVEEAKRILSLAVGRNEETLAFVIDGLRTENAQLRGLLREALEASWLDDEWWGNEIPDEWFVRAQAALEGKP